MTSTVKFRNNSRDVESILKDMKDGLTIVNESFQRKLVWHQNEMKQELIKSIILGMPIGAITFWDTFDDRGLPITQIVDGQQRLKTIQSFINNDFLLKTDIVREILKNKHIYGLITNYSKTDIKSQNILNLNKEGYKFSELPDYFQRSINNHHLNLIILDNINENEIRSYFKSLQNQEKLKAGEILHSFEDNHILYFLTQEEIDKFCNLTNFNDNRMGFQKHFTVFISMILNEKTRMGMPDDNIVKLAQKIKPTDYEDNDLLLQIIEKIKTDISKGVENDNSDEKKILSVLGLKLLFLTYLFSKNEFKNHSLIKKANIIKKITLMGGYWNSKDEEKRNKLKKKFEKYPDYDSELLNDGVRQTWKLGKTTHSKNEIAEKFESINYLINFLLENETFDYFLK